MCKYNAMICFLLNRMKFHVSLNGKTSQKAIKTALAVCFMLITFLKEGMCVISGFNARRLAPKLLQHQPDNKYIQKQKSGRTLWSKNIHKNIFSLKRAEK